MNGFLALFTTTTSGVPVEFYGSPRAVRCAHMVAEESMADARWLLEVLNKYGQLVEHPDDAPVRVVPDAEMPEWGEGLSVADWEKWL